MSRTLYEVLGVTPNATLDELRHAHRVQARRYHPDHRVGTDDGDIATGDADDRIRAVNAAWWVLSDRGRRAAYDRTLDDSSSQSAWSPFPPGTEAEPVGGFQEWFADAEQRRMDVRVATRGHHSARPPRMGLWIGTGIVLLLGILLVAMLAGTSPSDTPVGSRTGVCIRIDAGPHATQVPCSSDNDGRIVGFAPTPTGCPSGTFARRLDSGDASIACLESTAKGSEHF